MSRVGKLAIAIPQGVDVAVRAEAIAVKGALGTLEVAQNALVKVENNNGTLSFAQIGRASCRERV